MFRTVISVLACALAGCGSYRASSPSTPGQALASSSTSPSSAAAKASTPQAGDAHMRLGNFSVSLAVKDIRASREFYEKLGFRAVAGDQAKNWLILQNQTSTIGLFQGMFDKNVLTYNPGWDRSCNTLPEFDDVRELQRELKKRGLTPTMQVDESTTGPGSVTLSDPDGNQILLDQHVPSPKK